MAEGSSFEDANYFGEECCVICKQGFEMGNFTKVSEKGLLILISYSKNTETSMNSARVQRQSKVLVCRRDFTDAKRVICSNVSSSEPTKD